MGATIIGEVIEHPALAARMLLDAYHGVSHAQSC
jgi:hypothetical protein